MKERLTTDKQKIFARENPTIMSMTKETLRRHYNEIFDRLQEYEVAEENGNIIVPPCKVGDKVYEVLPKVNHIRTNTVVGFHLGKFPNIRGHKRKEYLVCYSDYSLTHIDIEKFGKTVFLSREEAERVLCGGIDMTYKER